LPVLTNQFDSSSSGRGYRLLADSLAHGLEMNRTQPCREWLVITSLYYFRGSDLIYHEANFLYRVPIETHFWILKSRVAKKIIYLIR